MTNILRSALILARKSKIAWGVVNLLEWVLVVLSHIGRKSMIVWTVFFQALVLGLLHYTVACKILVAFGITITLARFLFDRITAAKDLEKSMKRFWISWYQPGDDYRPLAYPPNAAILGWWCSGVSGNTSTMCALVAAKNEEGAQQAVRKDWPEADNWRFCNLRDDDYLPGDRFPLADWMKERIQK